MTVRALNALIMTLFALLAVNFAMANESGVTLPGAAGDAAAGKAKSAVCGACHGADGNSVNPEWPSIAGQHPGYLIAQLRNFKEGKRQNALMSAQALGLSDQDMDDLAAYYSTQTPKGGEVDPAHLSRGQRIYRGGNKASGVSACIACHGPGGNGNPLAIYPKLAGQHDIYIASQLRAYAKGERRTDDNQIMRNIASALSEDEIVAVASYIQGIR